MSLWTGGVRVSVSAEALQCASQGVQVGRVDERSSQLSIAESEHDGHGSLSGSRALSLAVRPSSLVPALVSGHYQIDTLLPCPLCIAEPTMRSYTFSGQQPRSPACEPDHPRLGRASMPPWTDSQYGSLTVHIPNTVLFTPHLCRIMLKTKADYHRMQRCPTVQRDHSHQLPQGVEDDGP